MSNDPQAIVVRAVQPEDYEQWLQLWLAYQDFYQVSLDETTTRTAFCPTIRDQQHIISPSLHLQTTLCPSP